MPWVCVRRALNGPVPTERCLVPPAALRHNQSRHTRRCAPGVDRKAAETASSPWLCLGSAAQYYRGAEAAVVVYDVASFVGGLILTRLIVHLQPLLVVVRLEHELEHTWFGFGFGFGLWFGFGVMVRVRVRARA